MDIGKLIVSLGVDTAGLDNADSAFRKWASKSQKRIDDVNKKWRDMGKTMKSTGRMLTTYISLPLAAVGVAAIKMHMDFEASMAKIVGLVGVSKKTVEGWTSTVKDMASTVGRKATELADALYFITSAGIRTNESLEVLEMSAKASAAGLGETKLIADLVTSAMNAFGKENLSAAAATDILTETVREGKAEATLLATTMGMVLPIAAELGSTFNQVGAAMAMMTRTGTTSATAAMQLRQIFNSILKPAKQAESALRAMGTSSAYLRNVIRRDGLLAALMEIRSLTNMYGEEIMATVFPNIRALSGVLDIMGKNLANNIRISDNLNNATGRLGKAFGAAAETTQFKFRKALAGVNTAAIEFGESMKSTIVPIFEKFTIVVIELTKWFRGLSDQTKKLILIFGSIAIAAGPIITVLGFITANTIPVLITAIGWLIISLKALGAVMWANPILAMAAVITFLGTQMYFASRAQDAAAEKTKNHTREIEKQAAAVAHLKRMEYLDFLKGMGIMHPSFDRELIPDKLYDDELKKAKTFWQRYVVIMDKVYAKIYYKVEGWLKKMKEEAPMPDPNIMPIGLNKFGQFIYTLRHQIKSDLKYIFTGVIGNKEILPVGQIQSEAKEILDTFNGMEHDIFKVMKNWDLSLSLDDFEKGLKALSVNDLESAALTTQQQIDDMNEAINSLNTVKFGETEVDLSVIEMADLEKLKKDLPLIEGMLAAINKELFDADKKAERFKKDWGEVVIGGPILKDMRGATVDFIDDMTMINNMLKLNISGFDEAKERAAAYAAVISGIVAEGGMMEGFGEKIDIGGLVVRKGFNLTKFLNENTDLAKFLEKELNGAKVTLALLVDLHNKWYQIAEDQKAAKRAKESLDDLTKAIREYRIALKLIDLQMDIIPDFDRAEAFKSAMEDYRLTLLKLKSEAIIELRTVTDPQALIDLNFELKRIQEELDSFSGSLESMTSGVGFIEHVFEQYRKQMAEVETTVSLFGETQDTITKKLDITKESLIALAKTLGYANPMVLMLASAFSLLSSQLDDFDDGVYNVDKELKNLKDELKRLDDVQATLGVYADKKGFESVGDFIEEMGIDFDLAIERTKALDAAMGKAFKNINASGIEKMFSFIFENFDKFKEKAKLTKDEIASLIQQTIQQMVNFAAAMASLMEAQKQRELSAAGQNARKRAEIEKKYYEKQKKWAIAQALINTALAVSVSFAQLGWPWGLIPAAFALAAGLVQVAAIQAQTFADGGIVYGETLARVGEYAGARSNPEVIAPLDRLAGLLKGVLWGGMQSMAPRMELSGYDRQFGTRERKPQKVTFRIEGSELVGVLENYGAEYNNM